MRVQYLTGVGGIKFRHIYNPSYPVLRNSEGVKGNIIQDYPQNHTATIFKCEKLRLFTKDHHN